MTPEVESNVGRGSPTRLSHYEVKLNSIFKVAYVRLSDQALTFETVAMRRRVDNERKAVVIGGPRGA
jgi:hypothetical protein